MNVKEIVCKSLITKSKLPDADYVINPYVGCNHGCVYCYAQFMCRFTGHNGEPWGSFMDVKTGGKISGNLDGKSVLFGSVTDPYNPLEKKYKATRGTLERLEKMNTNANIEILTKSPLVLRDVDLIKKLGGRVGISLSATDEKFVRITEKYAASPNQRVDVIKKLRENDIPVYVFLSPIFPFFSNWRDVVDTTYEFSEKICFENLNLRANYRTDVLKLIQDNYNGTYKRFLALYSDKDALREYWLNEGEKIREYMGGRNYSLYFFHEEIKKT